MFYISLLLPLLLIIVVNDAYRLNSNCSTTINSHMNIKKALNDMTNCSTDEVHTVLLEEGKYDGVGNYNLLFDGIVQISIKGLGNRIDDVIIDCNSIKEFAIVKHTSKLFIQNLCIQHCIGYLFSQGRSGGAINVLDNASLNATNVVFKHNSAPIDGIYGGKGGAISVESSAGSNFTGCSFLYNAAYGSEKQTGRAGAIYLDGNLASKIPMHVFNDCTFMNNIATGGNYQGAYAGAIMSFDVRAVFVSCKFYSNNAADIAVGTQGALGGAMLIYSGRFSSSNVTNTFHNCEFFNNTSGTRGLKSSIGGAFYIVNANVELNKCIIHNNIAIGSNRYLSLGGGSAIQIQGSSKYPSAVIINDCDIADNFAPYALDTKTTQYRGPGWIGSQLYPITADILVSGSNISEKCEYAIGCYDCIANSSCGWSFSTTSCDFRSKLNAITVSSACNCPNDCSNHGSCHENGKCICEIKYAGNDCSVKFEGEQAIRRAVSVAAGICSVLIAVIVISVFFRVNRKQLILSFITFVLSVWSLMSYIAWLASMMPYSKHFTSKVVNLIWLSLIGLTVCSLVNTIIIVFFIHGGIIDFGLPYQRIWYSWLSNNYKTASIIFVFSIYNIQLILLIASEALNMTLFHAPLTSITYHKIKLMSLIGVIRDIVHISVLACIHNELNNWSIFGILSIITTVTVSAISLLQSFVSFQLSTFDLPNKTSQLLIQNDDNSYVTEEFKDYLNEAEVLREISKLEQLLKLRKSQLAQIRAGQNNVVQQ